MKNYRFDPPEAVTGLPVQQLRQLREQSHRHPESPAPRPWWHSSRLAVLVAWSLRTETVDGGVEPPGSLLHPQVRQEAPPGYVIAELYQDGRLDLESGVYDGDGTLRGSHWTHHDVRQTCSLDLVLAVQEGRDQASPTATPRPTHTPSPTDPPRNPEEYAVVERTIDTDNGASIAVALLPTPRAGWPASTPRPTYTPYPTATPSPLVSSVSWIGWAGRPIVIAADGVAILDLPRGCHRIRQPQRLDRPAPNRPGPAGQAAFAGCAVVGRYRAPFGLKEASGRLLLASDHIDAHHRSARLSIQAGPLSDCHGLNLRWQQPAAIVVSALTEQPYADWQNHPLPPTPVPVTASLSGLTLTGVILDPAFDPGTTAYSAAVPFPTATTTVRPVLAHLSETYEINLGGSRQSDNAPGRDPAHRGRRQRHRHRRNLAPTATPPRPTPLPLRERRRPPTPPWPGWRWAARRPTSGLLLSHPVCSTTTCACRTPRCEPRRCPRRRILPQPSWCPPCPRTRSPTAATAPPWSSWPRTSPPS